MDWLHSTIYGYGPDATDILSVVAKRTYAITQGVLKAAEEQIPLVAADIPVHPESLLGSELLAESDMIPYKPTTDCIVLGKACAPRGKQAFHLDCRAAVGGLRKTVRVFGDRKIEYKVLKGHHFSEPRPFSEAAFSYHRAYGGASKLNPEEIETLQYPPNPIGAGFAIKGGFEDESALAVPNQEDPESPVTLDTCILDKYADWPKCPKPASFGWTRNFFFPRYTYAGIGPDVRKEAGGRMPSVLPCFDARYFQGASEGLWGKQLRGGEPVVLEYFDPDDPVFKFDLPSEKPVLFLDIGKGPVELPSVLQTIVIDMDQRLLSMVWRGHQKIEGVDSVERLEASAV